MALRRALQTFLAGGAAERSGMQHQELRLQRESALDLATKSGDGLGVEFGIASCEVHQIVGVDRQRAQVVLRAQANHLCYVCWAQLR